MARNTRRIDDSDRLASRRCWTRVSTGTEDSDRGVLCIEARRELKRADDEAELPAEAMLIRRNYVMSPGVGGNCCIILFFFLFLFLLSLSTVTVVSKGEGVRVTFEILHCGPGVYQGCG